MGFKGTRSIWTLAIGVISLLSFSLAGCGGGGGGVSSQVVSGVAAAGAPLSGSVSLKDSSSPPQEKTAAVDANGNYAIDVTGMQAPFIIEATGSVGGTNYTLCSFASGPGKANINPLSNLAVSDAAGGVDPASVYGNPGSYLQQIASNLASSVTALQTSLQQLLALYNASSINPVTGAYTANGTGLDALFDHVNVTLVSGNVTITNIDMPGVTPGASILTGSISNMNSWNLTNLPATPVAPAAPTGVTATGGNQQVTVSWVAVSGATSYNIYWSTTSGVTTTNGTKITGATSPYIHSGRADSTAYYYVVTAVNSAGEGAASAQASATTNAATPTPTVPSAPTGVTATPGTNQVTVSWTAVSGATSYNIYWSTTSGVTIANGTKITGATSPAVHNNLSASTTYYYIVTAVNGVGESAPSTQASATTPAPAPTVPSAPTGVTATGGTQQVSVSWTAVSGATSYNIYWSTTSGVTTANGTKITGATSPYAHTGLANSTAYFYVVTAQNSAGESAASAQATATTSAPALTCGTCHAIPPATGQHAFHVNSMQYSCAVCHGTGYSSTTVNSATHMNGVVNLTNSVGFNATAGTCTNSCHGTRTW